MEEHREYWLVKAAHWGLAGTVCLPGLLALMLTSRIPPGRVVNGALERSPLVFSQYSVNLREVPVQPIVHAHFDFWNRGDSSLTITSLEPSCACLAPRLLDDQHIFEPGQQGRFNVQMRTANETPGPKEYQVRVNYVCGGETGTALVTFKATLPAQKISLEPAQLIFYQINNKSAFKQLHVADYRGKPLQVLDATCADENVTVTVLDREVDRQGQLRVPILVEVDADVPPGRTNAVLSIKTNDPEFPQLQVPIILFGPSERVRMATGTGSANHAQGDEHQVRRAAGTQSTRKQEQEPQSPNHYQVPPDSSR